MTASVAMSFVLEAAWLALTPFERWSAIRSRLGGGSQSGRWMVVVCVVVLVVLLALFSLATMRRGRKARKMTRKSFEEYAGQRGLSVRERQLLAIVAGKAGLKRPESVFTIGSAFGIGAARMIEDMGEGEHADEAREQLKTEIAFLREKLGFAGNSPASGGPVEKVRKVTTRHIPVGKRLYVTRRKSPANSDIESTVARNNDTELAVTLSQTVNVVFGEMWCVRYYSEASVWEFDTTVVSYDGDTLVLNHSDDIRFVNRRRFLRVSVRLPAFVARFPFMTGGDRGDGIDMNQTSGRTWAPPEFVPAAITEMAGSGLRVESALEVEVGERLLVVLNLAEQSGEGLDLAEATGPKVVESIGEVRYIKAIERGFSIAVELTGLDDFEEDELIRATNAALLQASGRTEELALAAGQGE